LLEQTLCHGTLSVALNAQASQKKKTCLDNSSSLTPFFQREMCVLQKAGGIPLATDEIMNVVQIASRRVKELDVMVENVLKEDWNGRKVEIR
jgi:hypothetical protein